LNLKYDEPLSNFAFNFNPRRYSAGAAAALPVGRGRAVHIDSINTRVEGAYGLTA
jgi:hypothetical protein